ncbi:MAG: UDP-N-acetylglucosamine 2-epimerase (non-hydrolyzing), partial [Saprospiraceae bacterium]
MILVCFGTRPEIVKVAPVIQEMQRRKLPFKLVFTGQHRELYEDVRSLIPDPDFHLDIMKDNQSPNDILSGIISKMDLILREEKPKLVVVQGDTSTVLAASLAAFNNRVKIGHIEAGLRTYDLESPFPEEANRQLVSRIAYFNWAPTQRAADALASEGVSNIFLTGNTVIDTCRGFDFEISYGNEVIITLHRRENFGERMESHFRQINSLAEAHPELKFVFPMHPNPNVQSLRHLLTHVDVRAPFTYPEMVQMLSRARFA